MLILRQSIQAGASPIKCDTAPGSRMTKEKGIHLGTYYVPPSVLFVMLAEQSTMMPHIVLVNCHVLSELTEEKLALEAGLTPPLP